MTLEQSARRLQSARAAYIATAARLEAVRPRLEAEAATLLGTSASTEARLSALTDTRPAGRVRAEFDLLSDLTAQHFQAFRQAEHEHDALLVHTNSRPYVAKLRALVAAAEAVRVAHIEAEQEAARIAPLLTGGVALPRVPSPNEAALQVIAHAELVIARCSSESGQDERTENPLADCLNRYVKKIHAAMAPRPFFPMKPVRWAGTRWRT